MATIVPEPNSFKTLRAHHTRRILLPERGSFSRLGREMVRVQQFTWQTQGGVPVLPDLYREYVRQISTSGWGGDCQ